ncbi:hypothetical protein B0H19DRAFT_1099970 [Mycena capillaripes]|nr:hypothetical protein B0H19DRAFT_1099970 [Mycena capillaripes]
MTPAQLRFNPFLSMSHRVSTTARAIKDVLAVFSEIAGLIPIVGLDKIAKGILLVWEAVEQTKINSHLLRRLAERTTTFLATLEAQITQCSPAVVLKLESSIRGLNERLEKILEHIKLTSQSSIKQYLHRNDIRDSVVEYSAVLQDAVLLLGAQTQIVLMDWISQNDEDRRKEALASRELLEQIKKQLDDTNESVTALPDMVRGMFMDEVFDDGALAESPLALSDIVLGNPNTAGFAAATLDVTVKHFPATTPAQVYHYLQTVKTWSRFRHLNVLRVLWHSSLDAKPSPFIVVPKMETATLDNYLNQEWGRYSHPDIGTGIVSGLTYLRSRGLHITTLPASHIALNGHRPIIHGLDSQELNTSRNVMSKVFIADGILSVNRLDSIASEHFLDASFAYTEGDRSLGRLSTHFRPVSDGQDLSLPPDWKGLASEYSDDVDSALCILRIVIKHISIKARVDINLSLSMDELATSSVIQQVIRCLRNSAHTTKIYALRVIDSVANTQFRAQALIQMRVISHLRSLFSTPHSFTWGQVCWTVYRILDNYGEDYDPAEVLEEDLVLLQSFLKRKENAWSRATSMALLLSIWRRRVVSGQRHAYGTQCVPGPQETARAAPSPKCADPRSRSVCKFDTLAF